MSESVDQVAIKPRQTWLKVPEVANFWGVKWFVWMVTFFGRRPARAWLRVVIFYYAVLVPNARRQSRRYLEKMGMPTGFWDVYQHLLCFGQCILDRLFFVRGDVERFDVERRGQAHLEQLLSEKKGAILITSHLGSFEAMRAFAEDIDIPINVLVNVTNAEALNTVLQELNPKTKIRMLNVSGGLDFVFKAKKRIEAGEIIATMGDRVPENGKSTTAPFLGEDARFPVGPYELAAALRCPVFIAMGIYRGDNRYSLVCEPFADRIELRRKDRAKVLADHAAQYAKRLEHYCREAPLNWFNFFDFWA